MIYYTFCQAIIFWNTLESGGGKAEVQNLVQSEWGAIESHTTGNGKKFLKAHFQPHIYVYMYVWSKLGDL